MFDDSQSQAGAAMFTGTPRVDTVESLCQTGDVFSLDTDPLVFQRDADILVAASQPDIDTLAIRV